MLQKLQKSKYLVFVLSNTGFNFYKNYSLKIEVHIED